MRVPCHACEHRDVVCPDPCALICGVWAIHRILQAPWRDVPMSMSIRNGTQSRTLHGVVDIASCLYTCTSGFQSLPYFNPFPTLVFSEKTSHFGGVPTAPVACGGKAKGRNLNQE